MSKYVKVTSLKHLKEILAKGNGEFVLMLAGGLARSSKYLSYDADIDTFSVVNSIDDSEQDLTSKQIMDKECTNIGEGIRLGAFFFENYA